MRFIIVLTLTCWVTIKGQTEDCKMQTVRLHGAGSSLAAAIYTEMGTRYTARRQLEGQRVEFNYKSRNSGYGLGRITMTIADQPPIQFGASDKTMSNEQHIRYGHLKMFPTLAGALLTIYHVPEAGNTVLILSDKILVKIYEGVVRYWDDPEIKQLNKEINLTHNRIRVVVRSDNAGETFILTGALSEFGRKWAIDYGTFSNPEFVGEICCNSTRWPVDVVEFFAKGVNGMIGIVGSIPYALGYASETNVLDDGDTKFTHMVNAAGHLTTASASSVQAAMDYHLSLSRGSMVFNLNNAKVKEAYPMASFSYMVVNSSTHTEVSCCEMQELAGFIEFVVKSNPSDFGKHHLVPLSPRMVSSVMQNAVGIIQCRGKLVYNEYLTSLEKQFQFEVWHGLTIGLVAMLIILLGVVIVCSIQVHRGNQLAMKKWLLSGRVMFKTEISDVSIRIDQEDNREKTEKFYYKHGELEGVRVLLDMLNIHSSPRTWSHKTQMAVKNLRDNIIHPNVTNLLGISEMNAMNFAVLDYAAKGNLHYVLQTCQYELNESIKYNLALNAAEGLAFLHRKQIVHGQMSSINCYVDGLWTIKIGGWYRFGIISSEGNPHDIEAEFSLNGIESWQDLIRGIYLDADFMELKSYNCDVYSFGLLLVEIFSRKLPFKEPTETFVRDKMFKSLDVITAELNFGEMPAELQAVVIRCIGERSERPVSQDLVFLINQLKPLSGIVDAMMETMEDYTHNLEKQTADLTSMTKHMRDLLHEVLPPEIATKLLHGESVDPEFFDCVTIYFTDIIGFTDISQRSMPLEVMSLLNDLWVLFDSIIEKFDVYKVDTIGDAYMVCSGLPQRNNNMHSRNIADLALAILEAVSKFKIPHLPDEKLQIRSGMNSGPVTAGVVGSKMPQYCVFGDAVNTAARMESTCKPMKIQASNSSVELLETHFPNMYTLDLRGDVEVKGKGKMKTYWLSHPVRGAKISKHLSNKRLPETDSLVSSD